MPQLLCSKDVAVPHTQHLPQISLRPECCCATFPEGPWATDQRAHALSRHCSTPEPSGPPFLCPQTETTIWISYCPSEQVSPCHSPSVKDFPLHPSNTEMLPPTYRSLRKYRSHMYTVPGSCGGPLSKHLSQICLTSVETNMFIIHYCTNKKHALCLHNKYAMNLVCN